MSIGKIITKTIEHEALRVLESKGAVVYLNDGFIRYRECSKIEVKNEETSVWEEMFWDNDIFFLKSSITSIESYFDNDAGFYRIKIAYGGECIYLDCQDGIQAKDFLDTLTGYWLNNKFK